MSTQETGRSTGINERIDTFVKDVIKRKYGNLDALIAEHGFTGAAREIMARENARLRTTFHDPETVRVLKLGSAIVVYNHPNAVEPLMVAASLPDRADDSIYFPATQYAVGLFGDAVDSHLIPVYNIRGKKTANPLVLAWRATHNSGETDEEAKSRNGDTMIQMVRRLEEGAVICLAPTGGNGGNGGWSRGIGVLVAKMSRATDPVHMVFAHVEGTRTADAYRFFTGLPVSPFDFGITYSAPFSTPSIIKKFDDVAMDHERTPKGKGTEITNALRLTYDSWAGGGVPLTSDEMLHTFAEAVLIQASEDKKE